MVLHRTGSKPLPETVMTQFSSLGPFHFPVSYIGTSKFMYFVVRHVHKSSTALWAISGTPEQQSDTYVPI